MEKQREWHFLAISKDEQPTDSTWMKDTHSYWQMGYVTHTDHTTPQISM
jgi:hypothetical protein